VSANRSDLAGLPLLDDDDQAIHCFDNFGLGNAAGAIGRASDYNIASYKLAQAASSSGVSQS
jgi:hypothetical protein